MNFREYDNRFPQDSTIPALKLELFFSAGRWRTKSLAGVTTRTARGRYIFVVQESRLILAKDCKALGMARKVGHIDPADGRGIQFGGEIKFGGSESGRGILRWWNDRTGHYHAPGCPMDPLAVPFLPQVAFVRYEP